MNQSTRSGLYAALTLCAGLLCWPSAHAADDKPKAAASDQAAPKSASAPKPTAKSKKTEGEKAGTATPSRADTDKGGNISGLKKPTPPKVPEDAAKKGAVAQ